MRKEVRLVGTFVRNYRSPKGNTVFVFAVKGNAEQLAAYKEAQGDNYREAEGGTTPGVADGTPLFFSVRFPGKRADLLITPKGKVIVDMSAYEQAASLASQFGGNFGQELAKQAAAQLLGNGSSIAVEELMPADPAGLGKS